jgi:hypothetical protein
VKSAILYFSGLSGEYSGDNYTVVQSILGAGPGMSYPGVGAIGFEDDAPSLDGAIALGIARMWFDVLSVSGNYGNPMLNEGLFRSYTARYMHLRYPGRKFWESFPLSRGHAEFLGVDDIPAERDG